MITFLMCTSITVLVKTVISISKCDKLVCISTYIFFLRKKAKYTNLVFFSLPQVSLNSACAQKENDNTWLTWLVEISVPPSNFLFNMEG